MLLLKHILLLLPVVCASSTIRLQNWNLRYDSKANSITTDETIASLNSSIPSDQGITYYSDYTEEPWSTRRIGVVNEVLFNKADIFCVNEALVRQVDDLKQLLNQLSGEGWEYVGVGRDDGKEAGEFEAIFYNTAAISIESWDTIWLSETPFEPSKYAGAGSYRSATIAHIRAQSGNKFTLINTHLDDQSDDQRRLGASLLRQLGAHEYQYSEGPVFLVGDFNSNADGETDGAYQIATGGLDAVSLNQTFVDKYQSNISSTFKFDDLYSKTAAVNRLGHFSSFQGFFQYGDQTGLETGRIDFQLGGNPGTTNVATKGYSVDRFKIGEIFYDLGYHLSDHRPVITDLTIF